MVFLEEDFKAAISFLISSTCSRRVFNSVCNSSTWDSHLQGGDAISFLITIVLYLCFLGGSESSSEIEWLISFSGRKTKGERRGLLSLFLDSLTTLGAFMLKPLWQVTAENSFSGLWILATSIVNEFTWSPSETSFTQNCMHFLFLENL